MNLLPKDALLKTGPVDHADWNYDPLLQYVARSRFALILRMLPAQTGRLLEVGFGSGIFLPELAKRSDDLYGIDVHDHADAVQRRLAAHGVAARLSRQSAARTDFADGQFSAIVAVSALEFIGDIEAAGDELHRILEPGGRLYAVMPRVRRWLDVALRLATGEDARHDYGDRRERVLPALKRRFSVVRRLGWAIYDAYEFAAAEAPP